MAQAGNSTYLMESFNKLVHDLDKPLGVVSAALCCDSFQPPA